MSKRCDAENWTGKIELKEDGLPDLIRWSGEFRDIVGETFTIRGFEITADGEVAGDASRPTLRLPRGGPIRLAPLGRKIQWDPDLKKERPPTDAERKAFERLAALLVKSDGRPLKIRIVGVLEPPSDRDGPATLNVRDFKVEE